MNCDPLAPPLAAPWLANTGLRRIGARRCSARLCSSRLSSVGEAARPTVWWPAVAGCSRPATLLGSAFRFTAVRAGDSAELGAPGPACALRSSSRAACSACIRPASGTRPATNLPASLPGSGLTRPCASCGGATCGAARPVAKCGAPCGTAKFRAGAATWGDAMCGIAMCGGGAAMWGAADTWGIAGAACGIAGAACGIAGAAICGIAGAACAAGAAGAPPRGPPPCGGSAIATVVETNRTKTAAIAAHCKCRDMTKTPHNVLVQMRERYGSFRGCDARFATSALAPAKTRQPSIPNHSDGTDRTPIVRQDA